MFLMVAVLLAAGVELRVQPLQAEILVGEPLMAQVTWAATTRQVEVRRPDDISVVITGPGGYSSVLGGPSRSEDVVLPTPIKAGASIVTQVLLLHGDYLNTRRRGRNVLAFPVPGNYHIQVMHEGMKCASKPAQVLVVAPTGDEAEVYRQLYGSAGQPYDERRAAGLLSKFPQSRYLRMEKLGQITTRLMKVAGSVDPDTGESLTRLPQEERRAWQERQAQAILQEIETGEWGGWEEARLRLAIDTARGAGQPAVAERLEHNVLQRLPGSALAREIVHQRMRAEEADAKE